MHDHATAMLDSPPPPPATSAVPASRSRGFWSEAWIRFRRRKLAMLALCYVVFLTFVAIFAPAIAGTKPIVCKYKGQLYFPALGYLNRKWEDPDGVFYRDKFRKIFPENLKKNDPEGWAIWPLVYQDPYRRVRDGEWPEQPGNPSGDEGRPNEHNIFGTDQQGFDVFAQMVHGTTIALSVGFVSMSIAATIGIAVGAVAGYFGSWVDMALSRVIELVMCIPSLVLILALIAILERPTIWHMMAILGCTRWTDIARLTRAEFMKLREADFVIAAQSIGVGRVRIMFRYILPNALAPILVPITFGIASAILIEASLSFLGFGAPPPNPSWGTLLSAGRSNYQLWWLIVFPGTAIFLAVLAYNLIGEGIQDATDPRIQDPGR
jgi:peptide/nickel transport system permease protein